MSKRNQLLKRKLQQKRRNKFYLNLLKTALTKCRFFIDIKKIVIEYIHMLETTKINEFDQMNPQELGDALAKFEQQAVGKDPHYIKLNEARELARRYTNDVRKYLKQEGSVTRNDLIKLIQRLYSDRERSKLMGGYEDLGVREFSEAEIQALRQESQRLREQK